MQGQAAWEGKKIKCTTALHWFYSNENICIINRAFCSDRLLFATHVMRVQQGFFWFVFVFTVWHQLIRLGHGYIVQAKRVMVIIEIKGTKGFAGRLWDKPAVAETADTWDNHEGCQSNLQGFHLASVQNCRVLPTPRKAARQVSTRTFPSTHSQVRRLQAEVLLIFICLNFTHSGLPVYLVICGQVATNVGSVLLEKCIFVMDRNQSASAERTDGHVGSSALIFCAVKLEQERDTWKGLKFTTSKLQISIKSFNYPALPKVVRYAL